MLVALQLMIGRLRSVETELVQHHKMAALGVLAAGLAHELNNPASALQRGADLLQQVVPWWEACAERVGAQLLGSDPDLLDHLRDELAQAATVSAGDPIEQSDRIQEVEEWLAQQGLERPWEIAPAIVDAGYSRERLVELAGRVAPGAVPPLLSWLASGATVRGQLRAVAASSAATSGIVSAVKAYTRLDQAPIQDVDIHESLEQSLTIMRYQLRSVSVYRRFADHLPLITAYASELNQVWTNLISNAIDAMGGGGDLTISTGIGEQYVTVAFEDTGPGIPEEIRHRLFEPFFTTKAPGKGTGMGLAISYSIVRRHGGDIKVESRPGRTVFIVRLPLAGVST
jgi:signal transduction histidine kinase